jgi:LysR family glycine cleavage system transcriptional activator
MSDQIDWRHFPPLASLRAFEAMARTGGFSAAARALNVTHAAVAQQVRALEEYLGVSLANRDGRNLVLTEDGERLGAALTDGFQGIQATIEAIRARGEDRPLTVTLTPTFATNWLMPRLGRFWAAHPEISVSLRPDHRVLDLRREGIDLGIRYGMGQWPGVDTEFLVSGRHLVVGAPDLVPADRKLTPGEMARMPWVLEQDWPEQSSWISCCLGVEIADLQVTVFPNEELELSAARQGYGLYLANAAIVEDDIATGRLRVAYDDQDANPGYYIVVPAGPQRAAARQFVRWLKSSL